jgi:hypothetical protein
VEHLLYCSWPWSPYSSCPCFSGILHWHLATLCVWSAWLNDCLHDLYSSSCMTHSGRAKEIHETISYHHLYLDRGGEALVDFHTADKVFSHIVSRVQKRQNTLRQNQELFRLVYSIILLLLWKELFVVPPVHLSL